MGGQMDMGKRDEWVHWWLKKLEMRLSYFIRFSSFVTSRPVFFHARRKSSKCREIHND